MSSFATHILWSPESDTGDTWHLLQAKAEEGLPGLAFRARLNLIEGSLGRGVLLMVVVVVVVMLVTLVVRVVRVNFLDAGRHLYRRIGRRVSVGAVHPDKKRAIHRQNGYGF